MLDQDSLLTVIAMGSVALAILLCALLLLSSGAHLVLVAGRLMRGKPARFDGWQASRLIVIVVAGVAAIIAALAGERLLGQIVLFAGLFVVFCAPILLAIFKIRVVDMEKPANQHGPRRLGLALKNLVYIFALPGVMTAFVMTGVALDETRGGLASAWNAPAAGQMNYYMLPRPTQCSVYLRNLTPMTLDGRPRSPDHMIHAAEFWLDTTLNALTFSAFDTTGCYIRRVDYNRENPHMVAAVASYNLILLFVISTIVYSVFKQKVRKGVAKATAGAAT
ncbi:MAG TPA: hypothetical protein VLZ84_11365 [Asticcacaulis sp.]|nr:hypothetical protein [Asticcacaulis sp.]